MWIKVDQGLRQHFKIKQMARMLDTSAAAVCGHLQFLWSWALDYAPNGDISRFDAWDIADAAGWDGDPNRFYEALFAVGGKDRPGFLEHGDHGAVLIHDWMEHTGKIFETNQKDRDRMKNYRSAKKDNVNVPEPSPNVHEHEGGYPPAVHEQDTNVPERSPNVHEQNENVRRIDLDLDLERDREESKTDVNARTRATDAPAPPENSIDAEEVAAIWTEILEPIGFQKCGNAGDWLKKAVYDRVQEDLARASPEWWRETFGRAAQSKWLLRAKFFTLSWAVKNGEHLEKIRDGHYEDWRFAGKGSKAQIVEDAPRDINELLGELGMPLVADSVMPIIDATEEVNE